MLKSVDINRCKIVREKTVEYDAIETPVDVINLMHLLGYADMPEEYLVMLALNCHGDIVGISEISHGSDTCTVVSPSCAYRHAIQNCAHSVIFVHNHPSNHAEPSDEDIIASKRLTEAGQILGIPMLDFAIVTSDGFFSFKNEGLLE